MRHGDGSAVLAALTPGPSWCHEIKSCRVIWLLLSQ